MTTGRINQVRTIGGARACRAPPARERAPTRARAPPGPASRRAPSRFVGGHTASARSRRLRTPGRVSPRLGGARLGPRRGPSCPCRVASDARARLPAPRAGLGAELPMRGGPRGRSLASPRPAPASASARSRRLQTPGRVSPRLGGARHGPGPRGRALAGPQPTPSLPGQTASPLPSGSHIRSAGASTRQAVARPSVLSGCVLRLGRRRATRRPQPACFPWDGRPRGKTPPGYAAATARLMPRARLDATAHRRQDKDAPRPAAGQGLAPSACGAGALAAARGPSTVRFAC